MPNHIKRKQGRQGKGKRKEWDKLEMIGKRKARKLSET
jgi:hypothetical protein